MVKLTYRELQKELKKLRARGLVPNVALNQKTDILRNYLKDFQKESKKLRKNLPRFADDIFEQPTGRTFRVVLLTVYYRKRWNTDDGGWSKWYREKEDHRLKIKPEDIRDIKDKAYLYAMEHFNYDESKAEVRFDPTEWNDKVKYIIDDPEKYINSKRMLRDIPMLAAKVFKPEFLSNYNYIDVKSFDDHNNECVYELLVKLGISASKKKLFNIFKEAYEFMYVGITDDDDNEIEDPFNGEFTMKSGVTPAMIEYLCMKRKVMCYGYDQDSNLFMKYTPPVKSHMYKSVVFYSMLGHMYIVTDTSAIKSLAERAKGIETKRMSSSMFMDIEEKHISEECLFEDIPLEELDEIMATRNKDVEETMYVIYNKQNLNDEFLYYLNKGYIPQIKQANTTRIVRMFFKECKVALMATEINSCFTWKDIQSVCKKAGIPFNNQGLGTLLMQLKDEFFHIRRKRPTEAMKKSILERQENKCNICNKKLDGTIEYDHITPLSGGGDNSESNLQALHRECHFEKSKSENENGQWVKVDNFKSAFNKQGYDVVTSKEFKRYAFVETIYTPKSKKIADMTEYKYDISKCRRNILMYSKYQLPVYTVLDEVKKFNEDDNIVCGNYFVETDNYIPCRGYGWYSKPIVDMCLKYGIFTKEDIKFKYIPSLTIEAGFFKDFCTFLIHTFGCVNESLAKMSVNSFVGCYGALSRNHYVTKFASDVIEAATLYKNLPDPFVIPVELEDSTLFKVTGCYDIITRELGYPIYAQILDIEACEIFRMMKIVEKNGGIVCDVNTDAVRFFSPKKINIHKYFWDTEKTVPKYKWETVKPVECPKMGGWFRTESYTFKAHKYRMYEEPDSVEFDDVAKRIIESNKGTHIDGLAGTGKTYMLNKILELIPEDKKVLRLAPTNKACLLIGGQTIHKFCASMMSNNRVLRSKLSNLDYVVIDEISMVAEIFYQVFLQMKAIKPSLKFIITGDFGQLPVVCDRIKDADYFNSYALWELTDGRRLKLNKCRRSDDKLFNMYTNPTTINVKKFKFKDLTYTNLCFTNETRMMVNNLCVQKWFIEKDVQKYIEIEKLSYDKNSQSYNLSEGMPVIARITDVGKKIANNETFNVKKIGRDTITVVNDLEEEKEISLSQFNRYFYLAFAITIHKSQGQTITEKYTIFNWERLDNKLKYVAMSRATNMKDIQIK